MSPNRFAARKNIRKVNPNSSTDESENLRKHRPDYMLIVYMFLLLALGAVTVYAISPGITASQNLSENYFSFKQLTAIGLGIVTFFVASVMPIKNWKRLEIPLITLAIVVSLSVRLFGEPINGAYRWLEIGGISFQAAELIKLAIIVWLAGYLAMLRLNQGLSDVNTLKNLGLAVIAIVIVVAGLQSDFGSSAVMMAIVVSMAFIAGVPFHKLALFGAAVLILGTLAIASSSYRRERVSTFLNPTADCQNEGYQACQALITVGSGGMFGKGLGRSVQAYGYLPEAENDSIFAIVAEKFGFIGSAAMIGVFFGLFRRIKTVAMQAPNDYSRLLVSGILVWLSVQMMINIGAMIGVIPLKGITLPFVSYGGTSIIFVMAAVGVVFQISRYTELSHQKSSHRAYGSRRANSGHRVVRKRKWGSV